MDYAQLTITIKQDRPELRKRVCELANDNTDREQELFERVCERSISREIVREED